MPTGDHVVPPRPDQRADLPAIVVAGRPLLPASAARCGGPDRLPRLPLLAGPAGPFSRHPRFLLRAPSAMGLGRLARPQHAALGRSRPLLAALRGGVVSGTRRAGSLRRPSLFRRTGEPATRPRLHGSAARPLSPRRE